MSRPTPAVAASMEVWHDVVSGRAPDRLAELLHPDAVFRSPMAHTPYAGAEAVHLILSTVGTIFEGFTYHRSFVDEAGTSVVLEFSATVDGRQLKGIDMMRFDDDGRIVDFEVMIRPASGLQALGARMSARLNDVLPQYKKPGA